MLMVNSSMKLMVMNYLFIDVVTEELCVATEELFVATEELFVAFVAMIKV